MRLILQIIALSCIYILGERYALAVPMFANTVPMMIQTNANSRPMGMSLEDIRDVIPSQHVPMFLDTVYEAHRRIGLLDQARQFPDVPAHSAAFTAVFGQTWHNQVVWQRIDAIINYLVHSPVFLVPLSTLQAHDVAHVITGAVAVAAPALQQMAVTEAFFDPVNNLESRVGDLIHEKTHLSPTRTVDLWIWRQQGSNNIIVPLPSNASPQLRSLALEGYWGRDYNIIQQNAPFFVLNADAWKVLQFHLAHGRLPSQPTVWNMFSYFT